MGVFNIFGKGQEFDPKQFEKDLTAIVEKITSTNQQISGLRSRDKSIKRALIQYLTILYVLVCTYTYTRIPYNTVGRNIIARFISGQTPNQLLVTVAYPVVAIFFVKLIHYCFQWLINGRTRKLEALKKKHKDKIEELKKISNFNTTSELINKYDKPTQPQQQPQHPQAQQQSQKSEKAQPSRNTRPMSPLEKQALKELNLKQAPPSLDQLQPPKRNLQDRLLDILIGSDNNESIENRYALICYNCYTHNGLAPPNTTDPILVKYQCWKCGVMNGQDMLLHEMSKLDQQKSKEDLPEAQEEKEEEGEDDDDANEDDSKTATTPESSVESKEEIPAESN
ncbi:uncharacterized protein SPAPADRAFT_62169 [Spathaspora passalidarum NRRL Y-27907]|uniref:Endoplasmic reticulum junction formation protein lunapark n=1 Tax=Spathaspora passalidarum (strain NRRL Y-27907 / 11-Y1) TaxID=619300 RepID=G3AQL3_SPAPN|nr:uncharacterized protein SPAPADRAFT_62169 [Spathaspora passalidarum NRRL Y-27907]EGW31560.1 hypothetical protein SPAPADRAFT_62169 [Spathaspora passalidarum NRRL Y-27907]